MTAVASFPANCSLLIIIESKTPSPENIDIREALRSRKDARSVSLQNNMKLHVLKMIP